MMSPFKSMELFRYYVSNSIDSNFKEFIKSSNKHSLQLASTIFSSIASLSISFFSKSLTNGSSDIKTFIILILIFMGSYVLLYNIFKAIGNLYSKIKRQGKIFGGKLNQNDVKRIVDDFDHIACDSVLIASEFSQKYNTRKDIKEATFYYYETLYYAQKACTFIKIVLDNAEKCINNKKQVDRVDIYRLINLNSMIKQILTFIHKEQYKIEIVPELASFLSKQIEKLQTSSDDIDDLSQKFIQENL